jgi:S-(hydroxymethyl)mycothiol dehydrogenase
MGQQVRGVIARTRAAPVELVTVQVPDPGPGEVLVRVQACGVCHTDLHYREGAINDEFPFLLGHEASGTVEAVGPDVTNVAPGDFVVLAWRAPCGQCRSCLRGRPWYCFDSRNAGQKMTLEDGTPLSAAIGIGAFAEVCVNTAQVGRGDTVAVFGCGGVGNAAVHAAALVGARKVIAVDIDARKLELARQFGATDTVDSSQTNPVDAVRELTGGFGADVTVEAVGHPDVFKQAFHARDHAGTLVQVGVPNPQMRIDVRMLDFYGRGGSLRPAWYGDCLPTRDFPILIDLYLRGRYDLDRFVSETIALDQVEEAFAKMQRNEVLRSVVVFPDA